ncbi:MAG: hypothetical protein Q4E33_00245 [Erysipelotrichaceae bacterium]|nr:hypothetical protein [Erysipelotrichaceae bacterium]
MQLKTLNKANNIVLKDYTVNECRKIFLERNSYVLKLVNSYGEDYGGSQHSEETIVKYIEIIPERILVKNGHFYGAIILIDYDYYNGGQLDIKNDTILPIKGKAIGETKCGSSFSNDDHSRWNYTEYSIVERPDDVEVLCE